MIDLPPTRKLTIIAKDPGLRLGGDSGPMAFVQVPVPAEILSKGPIGYRIKVVDYNATERKAYADRQTYQTGDGTLVDPFAPGEGESALDPDYQARLLSDPNFHAQNAYAISMRTLGAFERALGRRISWSSGGHQLHIAPHAFAQANAFYSAPDRALLFGYFFKADGAPVFTSLSHDIVAHETTHAVLDGLRARFTEPSGPDQAAFHEGFADIVALLSIFSLPQVVAAAIGEDGSYVRSGRTFKAVAADKLTDEAIRQSILLGIAKQVGEELDASDRQALRRSVELDPDEGLEMRQSDDEHDRGYRATVRDSFATFGVTGAVDNADSEGCWPRYPYDGKLTYARSNYGAMTRSPDELFRFLWENRKAMGISERAYTEVLSIDGATRLGPDGISVTETVCQYVQRLDIFGAEFRSLLGAERPAGMSTTTRLTAYGGGVVVLDQYGQVKYHIANRIGDGERQALRAAYLLGAGKLEGTDPRLRFGLLHQTRMGA